MENKIIPDVGDAVHLSEKFIEWLTSKTRVELRSWGREMLLF